MFKKILIFLFVFFNFYYFTFANTYIETKIDDYKLKVVKYDIGNGFYDIKFGISDNATSVKNIMKKYNAVTGLNGIFFCPKDYTACKGKDFTINERYIEGKWLETYHTTGDRVVYAWDINKTPFLYQTDKINTDKKGDIYDGMANFPLLVKDGKNMIEYYYDVGLIDKKMLSDKLSRHFICNDKDKKNIYFGRGDGMSLDVLIDVLIKFGCYDALNLDAGYSSSFVYNGRQIVGPGRGIIDAVMITQNYFDVEKVNNIVDREVDKLKIKLDTENVDLYEDNILILTEARKILGKKRSKIYNKYSKDILDKDSSPIGYEISIQDGDVLRQIYTINTLDSSLASILNKIKKKQKKLTEAKKDLEIKK